MLYDKRLFTNLLIILTEINKINEKSKNSIPSDVYQIINEDLTRLNDYLRRYKNYELFIKSIPENNINEFMEMIKTYYYNEEPLILRKVDAYHIKKYEIISELINIFFNFFQEIIKKLLELLENAIRIIDEMKVKEIEKYSSSSSYNIQTRALILDTLVNELENAIKQEPTETNDLKIEKLKKDIDKIKNSSKKSRVEIEIKDFEKMSVDNILERKLLNIKKIDIDLYKFLKNQKDYENLENHIERYYLNK